MYSYMLSKLITRVKEEKKKKKTSQGFAVDKHERKHKDSMT